jgi:hypothetical protein
MENFRNMEQIDTKQEDLRMTILIDNHGKEVEGVDEADLRRAEEIF